MKDKMKILQRKIEIKEQLIKLTEKEINDLKRARLDIYLKRAQELAKNKLNNYDNLPF